MSNLIESLESRILLSAAPAPAPGAGLLAQLKVVDSDSKAFQRIDAGGLKAIAAALKAAKLTKTDASAIRVLDKSDAAKTKIVARGVAANDKVISSDVKKLVADGNALAKKPNARLSAAVASLTNALSASPSNELTPLTNDGAALQNTDDTNSSAIATANPSLTALDTAITSYQTSLASSLQTLAGAITTALTTDVGNFLEVVAVLYSGD